MAGLLLDRNWWLVVIRSNNIANMKNMQMDNMNMDNSSTNHHTSMGHMTMMKNYFHFSAEAVVLFFGWRTETWPGKYTDFL